MPSQVGLSAISCVHCVIASTKTRSKNSSSGLTRSPWRMAGVMRRSGRRGFHGDEPRTCGEPFGERVSTIWAMRRSDQRRDAVFALYQHEVTGRPLEELLEDAKPFTRELAEGTEANRAELDELISRHSKGWALERIAPLERSIMRVALQEALHDDEVPVEVAIDEAVELSKEYCGADAPGFVNGILGAAAVSASRAA